MSDILKQLRDPSVFMVSRKDTADRIEELEERLKAATDDAKEAEDYAGELEANLAEQVEWVKSLADDLIAAEGREARLKEKLAKAEWLLVDAAVQLEEGKIKTRRNRAVLIRQLLAELTGGKDE